MSLLCLLRTDLSRNVITSRGAQILGQAIAKLGTHTPTTAASIPQSTSTLARQCSSGLKESRRIRVNESERKDSPAASMSAAAQDTIRDSAAGSTMVAIGTQGRDVRYGSGASSRLEAVILDHNRLGIDGMVHILKGVAVLAEMESQAGQPAANDNSSSYNNRSQRSPSSLHEVSLDGNLLATLKTGVAGACSTLPWDDQHPTGTHTMDLAVKEHRQFAATLVSMGVAGRVSWLSAALKSQLLVSSTLPPASWSRQLPTEGTLQVSVASAISLSQTTTTPMDALLEGIVTSQMDHPASSEELRMALVSALTAVTTVTASQAARLVWRMQYSSSKVVRAHMCSIRVRVFYRCTYVLYVYMHMCYIRAKDIHVLYVYMCSMTCIYLTRNRPTRTQ